MSDPSNVICSCAGLEFDVRRRANTKVAADASDPAPAAIPLLYQYQPQMQADSAHLPALVFSLAPNSFVYSDARLQLARRWKSILQHLARFAFRRRGLAAMSPRKEKFLMEANSLKAHRLTRENQSVACVQLAPPLFVFVLF